MKMGAAGAIAAVEVPIEDCPLGECVSYHEFLTNTHGVLLAPALTSHRLVQVFARLSV
jgi:hypothetical protein